MSRVGKNIDAHCLKCKLVLAHIIMYEVDGVVSKVKCKTCGAEHKYRGTKPPVPKSDREVRAAKEKRLKTNASKSSANPAPIEWETRRRNMDEGEPIKAYAIQDIYRAGEVIRHPVFDLGFVERVVSDKRMEVLFKDAVKSMAMNIH